MSEVRLFQLGIPQADLDDLRNRLQRTRFPEEATVDGWIQGVPLPRMRDLIDYWRDDYDWRRCEAKLNALGQHKTNIDGLDIHFLHVRSRHANALPIILTHGWPGSVLEFTKVIAPLTDPEAHGGYAADAFHVIAPSLPGFGFSDKPTTAGCGVEKIARMWAQLMERLGYDNYVAQGGDWGSSVTVQMGRQALPGLIAIHLNMISARPQTPDPHPDAETAHAIEALTKFADTGSGYARLQATRPQTIGYALADSPAGQAAWIYEKFQGWSDCDGDPETIFTRDELLDNIMIYWLTNSGASSARLYYESLSSFRPIEVALPVGISLFPKDTIQTSRKWIDAVFPNIIHWNRLDRGGHFAALEQPELFVQEMRTCFAKVRPV